MSLNEMVENEGVRVEDNKVDLNVNPNVTTDRNKNFTTKIIGVHSKIWI